MLTKGLYTGINGAGRRKRRVRGGNFLDDVWSGVKNVGASLAPYTPLLLGLGRRRRTAVHRKRTRGGMISTAVLHRQGYGVRKRYATRRRRRGGSLLSTLRSAYNTAKPYLGQLHNYVKRNRYVSKGLANYGMSGLSRIARMYGYGKRRRVRRRLR